MKNIQRITLAALSISSLILTTPAGAVPTLQLGITDGWYDNISETAVASQPAFTLNAYLHPKAEIAPLNADYFLSYALSPQVNPAQGYGSFSIDGVTIDIGGDLTYGTPPLDQNAPHSAKSLARHGIFPTLFGEQAFSFGNQQTAIVNTQDKPGNDPAQVTGSGMYYQQFAIDVSSLSPGYSMHFDLYRSVMLHSQSRQIIAFAPFSHDAESAPTLSPGPTPVSTPATAALFGLGLLGLLWTQRREKRSRV